jgi:hypothetical protein
MQLECPKCPGVVTCSECQMTTYTDDGWEARMAERASRLARAQMRLERALG